MKKSQRIVAFLGLMAFGALAHAATQFSQKDYDLYAGDFNGDGQSDLLYVGKSPDKPNGIALSDVNGAPQIGFQSWSANYLGVSWSTGQYIPVIGDFNGDSQSDVLMQSATPGTSFVLLANSDPALGAVGQLIGIHQAIGQTAFGINWSADQHKLFVGDFDEDGKDDVLAQATTKGGTNAIILTDGGGGLFTRYSSNCWSGGPQQCWTDGYQGLSWSTKDAVLTVGKFDSADARADLLYQPRPKITLLGYDIPIPVPVFKPNTFGIFLGQAANGAGEIIRTANQLWSKSDRGASWSPTFGAALIGDFNGDGFGDVLLQFNGGGNKISYGNSAGVLGTAVPAAGNAGVFGRSTHRAIVGKFGTSPHSVLYMQAKDPSSDNYYLSDASASVVHAYVSPLMIAGRMPTAPTAAGATPATADVTQNGSAAYTISIQLPKGTAGLTPELSLTYSSGSSNGLVGVGWNIAGLGIITRCPQTLAQDGVTRDVQLAVTDQYCLNGNRLRLVPGTGMQGSAGSQYRTELETYALITANGTGTQGPVSFTVKTKDGLIYTYGGTSSSNIGVPGNLDVTRVWALSMVSDRALGATSGNFWTVSYINEATAGGSGSYRPDYIDYTRNVMALPDEAPYRVKFLYGNRNVGERVISYYHGGRIEHTQRLTGIQLQTTNGASLIRSYALTYETPTTTFNLVSRLQSVQECSPTACMAPTTFAWSNSQLAGGAPALGAGRTELGYASSTEGSTDYPDLPSYYLTRSWTADVNGDGIPDAFQIYSHNGPSGPPPVVYAYTASLYIGTPTGPSLVWQATPIGPQPVIYDIDEDGKEDLVFGNVYLHQRSDGSYGTDPVLYSMPSPGQLTADLNGDGYVDSLWPQIDPGNPGNTSLIARYHRVDGVPGFEPQAVTVYAPPATTPILNFSIYVGSAEPRARQNIAYTDIDGNGRQDVLVQLSTGWRVIYSNDNNGFTEGEMIVSASHTNGLPSSVSYFPPVPIDLNGDGCTDFAYAKKVGATYYWFLARSSCRGDGSGLTVDIPTYVAVTGLKWVPTSGDWGSASAADINGDGNMDLVSGSVTVLSNGETLTSSVSMPTDVLNRMEIWSDRDGDGVLDYVISQGRHADEYFPGLGKKPNYLLSATDGFGKTISFDYGPLTDPAVYRRGSGQTGRTRDFQSSMYVAKLMTLSDGIGGSYTQKYVYSRAKRNIRGRGFLGFATREITDSRTGFVTVEQYNNTVTDADTSWEYVGTLANRTVRQYWSGGGYGPKLEELVQDWLAIKPDEQENRRYPYVHASSLDRYELNSGALITNTSTINSIDNYGTVYDTTTTVTEKGSGLYPNSIARVRRYTPLTEILNHSANWCISRPRREEDERTHTLSVADGATITRVTTQTWDAERCRPTHMTVAPGSGYQLDTAIGYDLFNNINKTTVTGANISKAPLVTEWDYGLTGHLLQWTKNAKGHFTSYGWSVPYGFKTSETVKLSQAASTGLTTTWIPDDLGREKEMIRPDLTRTFKRYFNCVASNDYCGDRLVRYVVRTEERNTANDENNLINYSDRFFDVMGRVKYEQSRGFEGQTVVTGMLYDNRGNVVLKTHPYFAGAGSASGISMEYDGLNRLTRTVRPASDSPGTLVNEYVVYEGLKTRSFDANGLETSKVLSALGTVARATDAAGKHTNYTYNSFGELLTATDPGGNVSSIHYIASRGFKDASDDPDMGHWSYTYDELGQVLTQTDAKNQVTKFVYDALGRIETRTDGFGSGSPEVSVFTYDTAVGGYGVGQLYAVTSPNYAESYAYDSKGRRSQMTTTAFGTNYVMDYGYDPNHGKLSSITYPASTGTRLGVSYGYQNGFAKDVRNTATNGVLWQANAQDARGHVTQEQYGNGLITNLGFDQTSGRLYSVQTGLGATQNLTYTWDAVGNLTARSDVRQNIIENFGYDALYRVTSMQRLGTTATLSTVAYDDIGNITSKSGVGSYVYSGSQAGCSYSGLTAQPHAVRKAGASDVYCYDANGNMVSRKGATVTWSTFNYPLTINQTGGSTSTFYYGANRNRFRQVSVDGGVTEDRITVAGGAFEKLVRDSTTEYRHFIQIEGKAVAIVKRSTAAGSDDTFYLHEDHLGSTDVITNAVGAVVARMSFDAWGQRRGSDWTGTPSAADKAAISLTTHQGFTGHEQLDNLNLVHMNGRVYDPVLGRFMSADPIIQDPYHSQSFNRYTYVWNNPLNATDPTGFMCDPVMKTGSRIAEKCEKPNEKADAPKDVAQNGQSRGQTAQQPSAEPPKNSAQSTSDPDPAKVKKIEGDMRPNRKLVENGRVTLTINEKYKMMELTFKVKAFDGRSASSKENRTFKQAASSMSDPWNGQYRDSQGWIRRVRTEVTEAADREDADFELRDRGFFERGDGGVSFDQQTMSVKPGAQAAVLGHEMGHILGLADRYREEPLGRVLNYNIGMRRIDDPLFHRDIMQNIAAKPDRATLFSLVDKYQRLLQ